MINERLKLLRSSFKLNQREFSEKINVGQSTLAMFETGDRAPKDIHIAQICSAFNVNEEWLRNGIGEMFIENSVISLDEFAKKNNISEFETDVMKLYMTLDEKVRNEFMQGLRELALKSTTKKNLSVVKKEELPPGAPVAAHNDAPLTEEEIALMREDLENLSKI